MADFSGRLTVINSQSSLDNDLLLRAGIPDATQAIFAATQFLLKSRSLNPGQMIIVTGDRGTFGNVGVIVMTDARGASGPFAVTASVSAAAAKSSSGRKAAKSGAKKAGAAKGSKKAGGKKSAATSQTAGSKSGASKKTAGRKRGPSKPSAKKR